MEYIEGRSLAEMLEKGPLPLDQAIRYGIQIAEALGRGHRSRACWSGFMPLPDVMKPPG